MKNFSEFEHKIINSLKDSSLIKRFSFSEFSQTPDSSIIEELFNKPVPIDFDDGGIFYKDENEEKCYCPEMYTTISEEGIWLSDNLPSIDFDIYQNGNVRMADEAEALYCTIVVANIIKEECFKEQIRTVLDKYDFSKMAPYNEEVLTFRNLLTEWQGLQSVIINIIISAAKFKISDTKKDTEKFLRDGISESEAAGLRDLEAKVRSVNFQYSEGELSPLEVKKLSKVERLLLINKRDDEISRLITDSHEGILYKLMNLSTEYISPVKKKKVNLWVQKEVDSFLSDPKFSSLIEERSQLIAKFRRRALRFEKNSVRRLHVEKYMKDRENFKFPRKL